MTTKFIGIGYNFQLMIDYDEYYLRDIHLAESIGPFNAETAEALANAILDDLGKGAHKPSEKQPEKSGYFVAQYSDQMVNLAYYDLKSDNWLKLDDIPTEIAKIDYWWDWPQAIKENK